MSYTPPIGDASTTKKGVVQLAGDLSGTAAAPVVVDNAITEPKLAANNAPGTNQVLSWNGGALSWTNMSAGGTASVPPSSKVVAAADAPTAVKNVADYVCDGTADEVEINNAIASLWTGDTATLGAQGGRVLLWGKKFSISSPVLIHSYVTLSGHGQFSTCLQATSALTASYTAVTGRPIGVIQLATSGTQYTTVCDLTIDGNDDAGARTCGIYYINGAGSFGWDASHRLRNLYIYNTTSHGICLDYVSATGVNNRATYVENVRIIEAGGTGERDPDSSGIYCANADSFFSGVDVGSSSGHGFQFHGGNHRIVNCKAWFSGGGATAAHEGCGFYIKANRNEISGCEAQDNYGDGFYIGSSDNCLSGCLADSNGYNRNPNQSTSPIWTGSGYYVKWDRNNIQGSALDKNEGGRGIFQKHAVEFGTSGLKTLIINVTTGTCGVANTGGSSVDPASIINVLGL